MRHQILRMPWFLFQFLNRTAKKTIERMQHDYLRDSFFLLVLGSSIYFLVALVSFNPLDPSSIAASFPQAIISNLAGAVGARLSGYMIYVFGITAYLLPLPFMTTAVLLVVKNKNALALSRITGWILAFGCLLYFTQTFLPPFHVKNFELASAGHLGIAIATRFNFLFGSTGCLILASTLAFCSAILLFRLNVIGRSFAKASEFKPKFTINFRPHWPNFIAKRATPTPEAAAPRVTPPVINTYNEPAVREPDLDFIERFEVDEDPPEEPSYAPPKKAVSDQPATQTPYIAPSMAIFKTSESFGPLSLQQKKEFEITATLLTKTFEDFSILGKVVAIQPGPVVTVFEFQPDAGTKIAKMVSLIDDLALALKVDSIFIHPVKGKHAVGVQVPNQHREIVRLGDVINSADYKNSASPLTLALGKSISGEPVCVDICKMPHLLTAGATGSGKSVAIHALLCSVIMKSSPDQVRMILVDPKMLELSVYEGIPHLLMPVITEAPKASMALKWATNEMERRYKLMQMARVRHISGFNEFWDSATKDQKKELQAVLNDESICKLPYILLVIDELADLMLTAPKDVESSIQRLAQKARASGIHLVLATQRPSVDIITGVIKANLPCRAAFQVVSKHDSRTILDKIGADKLLGNGDMLMQLPGVPRLERIQGAYISDDEVNALVESVKQSGGPSYDEQVIDWIDQEIQRAQDDRGDLAIDFSNAEEDPKYDIAIQIAQTHGSVSASFLQRHLKIGYNRAARIVEAMQAQGLVAAADGAKPRRWLGAGSTGL
jgi:S-DNA-T family DNA segregation ATPase FtsK/SpoIIIE